MHVVSFYFIILITYRWLDKLGIAAVVGHERVCRQDFVGGNYALLDSDQNLLPVSSYLCNQLSTHNYVVFFSGLLAVSTA